MGKYERGGMIVAKTFVDNFNEIKQYTMCINTNYITCKADFALQFEILGEGEGIFYIEFRNRNLFIEPYTYYDNVARVRAAADIIKELIQGNITINDAIRDDEIMIISSVDDGLKKAFSFFDTCCNSQKMRNINACNQSNNHIATSSNPWENLRIYIENSDIDEESKNQLLANIVKFTSKELHILIVGGCGCGKSSTINALFNMDIAHVGYGVDAETQNISVYKLDNMYLHDTPGIGESPTADKKHMENIKLALRETDSDGHAVIDVVLVIVDASNRDMRSSFELINEVVIPNLQNKDRILIGINRCDLALDGKGWVEKYNYPNVELLQRLQEKAESVRRRIKEDTGVDVEPIFYSALYKYNISKLLSYLVKSAPTTKRIFFAEKINKNPDNFLRDDTSILVKRNKASEKVKELQRSSNFEPNKLYEQVDNINSKISGLERKIETIHIDIKSDKSEKNKISFADILEDALKENSASVNAQEDDNLNKSYCPKGSNETQNETDDDTENEYELVKTDKAQYKDTIQNAMEESFEAVSEEISKGSNEKVRISFINMLSNMKESVKAGIELGQEVGDAIPYIGASIGGMVGALIGGVGGLISGIFKHKKQN